MQRNSRRTAGCKHSLAENATVAAVAVAAAVAAEVLQVDNVGTA